MDLIFNLIGLNKSRKKYFGKIEIFLNLKYFEGEKIQKRMLKNSHFPPPYNSGFNKFIYSHIDSFKRESENEH